jgi:ketosteroid isomerase-like protein
MEGRKVIEQNMAIDFSGSMKGSTHKLIIKEAYSVSSTVAVADGIAEVAMGDYEPWTSMFTAVFSKNENNIWKIAHMRAYIFYPN